MGESETKKGHEWARAMLEAFGSVGATRFDVTWTNAAGDEERFRRGRMAWDLRRTIPAILDEAERRQFNVIVRPRTDADVTLVQLDDLNLENVTRVAAAVFLTLETSRGSFQAWAAVRPAPDEDFVRRLKKGAGADANASGATRIAGSFNWKPKYAPNFPMVVIREMHPGRVTTAAELELTDLVAKPEPPPLFNPPARARTASAFNRTWPSFAVALDRAPLKNDGSGPDTSSADIAFCMTARVGNRAAAHAGARIESIQTRREICPRHGAQGRAVRTSTSEAARDGMNGPSWGHRRIFPKSYAKDLRRALTPRRARRSASRLLSESSVKI